MPNPGYQSEFQGALRSATSPADAAGLLAGVAVADIPDPASATAADVAAKVNEILASLRTAGLIAAE
ncbi:hypothetical protein [Nocardiopsis sp. FR26]|uniref:hypothetical protein n=1 Tax=Nocardiopsis sp. FR26 TaxID=2605987 RepID=UPI00135ADDFF|nr:hypothetical protein [Nocardiopsis sp. FR26]